MSAPSKVYSEPVTHVLAKYPDLRLPLVKAEGKELPEYRGIAELPVSILFPGAREPKAALSGLLLLLGGWDDSHREAQDLTTAEGSYWHAIAHRLEPDYGNAAYWFRKAGAHPVFGELRNRALQILAEEPEAKWSVPETWDPLALIKLCEGANGERGRWKERLALSIQDAEWNCLFHWCANDEGS